MEKSKKEYKSLYLFDVMDSVKHFEDVYMVDREEKVVQCVAEMQVGDLASVLSLAEREKNRFDFYVRLEQKHE